MKKALALLLTLAMTLVLCACGCKCNCACAQNAAENSTLPADANNSTEGQKIAADPESSTPSADANESTGEQQAAADAESTTPSASGNESAAERQAAADTKGSTPSAGGNKLTAEQQIVVDAVKAQLHSETFAAWQSLAKDFKGGEPKSPEVTAVYHYSVDDFEEEAVDCYLVNVSADVGYWDNEEAGQGSLAERYQIFISADGKTVLDSISTDAGNFNGDTSTSEGRATYLLWMFGNMMDGRYEGDFLHNQETVTIWSDADLKVVNENI